MRRVESIVFSMFVYLIAGYLIGLTIGFTLFDPNTDVYALLSLVLSVVGLIVGVLPFFRRHARLVFGAIIGFYLSMILATLLFGSPAEDDLLEVLQRGGLSILVVLVGTIVGAGLASRLRDQDVGWAALAFLLGGFLGGYVFSVVLGFVPSSSMVYSAPFVIGSGLVAYVVVRLLTRSRPAGAMAVGTPG